MPNSTPPIFEATELDQIAAHAPRHPGHSAQAQFVVGAISHGLSLDLINYGYTTGLMPWPTAADIAQDLYPWGRVSPCTVIETQKVKISRSFQTCVRDALGGHYHGQSLQILLNDNYKEMVDTVADHYQFTRDGTWISNEMRAYWKEAHRYGLTHSISVLMNGKLQGGLLFGNKGGMLYGESAFSWHDDASRLALLALCALGRIYDLPLIDCQMNSPFVSKFHPQTWDWDRYIPEQMRAVTLPSPNWGLIPRDLVPLLKEAFREFKPRRKEEAEEALAKAQRASALIDPIPAALLHRPEGMEEPSEEENAFFESLLEEEEEPDAEEEDEWDYPEFNENFDYSQLPPQLSEDNGEDIMCIGWRDIVVGRLGKRVPIIRRPCSYHDGRYALHEVWMTPDSTEHEKNARLYSILSTFGFRRECDFFSRPICQGCNECLGTRVDVTRFKRNKTMRRLVNRYRHLVATFQVGLELTDEYWDLYQRYVKVRHPESGMRTFTREELQIALFDTCTLTGAVEIRTPSTDKNPNQLLMVCIIDLLDNAISAVYNFYDPEYDSLGTFGILMELSLARQFKLTYAYLGHWLKDFPGMDYKRHYRPMSVYSKNRWISLETALSADES